MKKQVKVQKRLTIVVDCIVNRKTELKKYMIESGVYTSLCMLEDRFKKELTKIESMLSSADFKISTQIKNIKEE